MKLDLTHSNHEKLDLNNISSKISIQYGQQHIQVED